MLPFVRSAPCLLFAALAASGPAAQAPPPTPLPSELEEKIEVRLVTIDVVALDDDEVTVPDLIKDDLEVFVDGKPAAIDTFDAYCGAGAEADPKSLHFGEWPTPRDLQNGTRRVVLAFDYLHLTTTPCPGSVEGSCTYHTQALQDFQQVFKAKTDIADEELMVVALTGGLRVEQPFTKDREAVIGTLHRMEHDISLWNGNFAHLTEEPLFRSLDALVTVLRTSPGPKAVVFVSVGSGPGGFYDLDFDRLAAIASEAQVTFYTVDLMGTMEGTPTGGPPGLFRLASMTGGRLTSNTNDPTIGYARARRDLGCRYTIGFYDHHPEADKQHRVSVNSLRKGVHLNYGARYSIPSQKERRRQALEAAFLVPQQFAGGGLRAHVFPLQPQDAKTWKAVLVVDFPVELPRSGLGATWEFGVVLRRGTDVLHTFNRSISVKATDEDPRGEPPRVTFVEPVTLPPGTYALTAVLALPEGTKPFGQVADLTVPPLPKREVILTGPVLGRRRGDDVIVYGGGDAQGAAGDHLGARDAFRPLLIDEVDRSEPVAALTNACVLRPKAKDGPWSLWRRLETESGALAGSLADVRFTASARTPVQCESLLDELPVQQLKPGRYTFRAVLAAEDAKEEHLKEAVAPFVVSDPVPAARKD